MRPQSPAVFLGRQPILNRQGLVVAYELLFRASTGQDVVDITDDSHASMNVITHAFRHFGSSAVVGESKAFINFNAQLLMSNVIEALPKDRVVIELLETVDIDDELIRRCRDLKAQGYRLALGDFSGYREAYEPLLEIVDIVKVDIPLLDWASLAALVHRFRLWPARLLAEKVNTPARARQCLALGFDLFQGFLFARPVVLTA